MTEKEVLEKELEFEMLLRGQEGLKGVSAHKLMTKRYQRYKNIMYMYIV